MQPSVTVVIPTFNKKNLLKECLDSLKWQTMKEFDIVVVDNGSTDGTAELLEEASTRLKVIKNKKNLGFVAVNQGIKASKTKYIVLLNNDAIAEPNWLEELVKGMENDEKVYFGASKILKMEDKTKLDSAGDGFNLGLMSGYSIGHDQDQSKFMDEQYCFSASGGGAIYRKEIFEKIGLFDEKFFAYFEDIDLGFRAQFQGLRCKFFPKAILCHEGGSTAVHYSGFHLKQTDRNKMLVILKNMPVKFFWKYKKPTLKILLWPKQQIKEHQFKISDVILNRFIILVWLPIIFSQRYRIFKTKVIDDQALENLLV